jgi:hypothetical protein
MAYNPHKELTPTGNLAELPFLIIERQATATGEDWAFHHRLIEALLNRHEEVANCAVDIDGQAVYVTLSGDEFDADDIERIDAHLREAIGRVTNFDWKE